VVEQRSSHRINICQVQCVNNPILFLFLVANVTEFVETWTERYWFYQKGKWEIRAALDHPPATFSVQCSEMPMQNTTRPNPIIVCECIKKIGVNICLVAQCSLGGLVCLFGCLFCFVGITNRRVVLKYYDKNTIWYVLIRYLPNTSPRKDVCVFCRRPIPQPFSLGTFRCLFQAQTAYECQWSDGKWHIG